MSSIVVAGDTSGSVTLSAPAVAGSTVLTLPAVSGTVITNTAGVVTQAMLSTNVAGNGPAFSAYQSATQSFTANTFTKITLDTEIFDTNNNFATNRFTPTVAGYYQINGIARIQTTIGTLIQVAIYKNGTIYTAGNLLNFAVGSNSNQLTVSDLVYCNGSTDYIELYGYSDGTSPSFNYNSTGNTSKFSASMIRSA
jgi:hypothetical protein